jgi:hypothetical protein
MPLELNLQDNVRKLFVLHSNWVAASCGRIGNCRIIEELMGYVLNAT